MRKKRANSRKNHLIVPPDGCFFKLLLSPLSALLLLFLSASSLPSYAPVSFTKSTDSINQRSRPGSMKWCTAHTRKLHQAKTLFFTFQNVEVGGGWWWFVFQIHFSHLTQVGSNADEGRPLLFPPHHPIKQQVSTQSTVHITSFGGNCSSDLEI